MTITQSRSTSGTGNLSLAFSSNNAGGSLLVVVVGELSGADTFGVTDTQGNTYQSLAAVVDGGSASQWQIFYCLSAKAGANTVSFTCSNGQATILAIHEFPAVIGFDISASAANVGITADSGPATITHATELLFGFSGVSASSGTVAGLDHGTGWTAAETQGIGGTLALMTEWQTAASTGSYDATVTIARSGKGVIINWAAEIAAYSLSGATLSLMTMGVGQ